MIIVWSDEALADLESISGDLKLYSEAAERRLKERIRDRLRQLREFPLSGRELPEFQMANIRELIVDRYRLVYEPSGETITILAFRPGAIPLDVVADDWEAETGNGPSP